MLLARRDGRRFLLRRCRRSDQAHFDTCLRLRGTGVSAAIHEAREKYSPGVDDGDRNICLSFDTRELLNDRVQTIICQTIYEIIPGAKLSSINSTLKPIVNSA